MNPFTEILVESLAADFPEIKSIVDEHLIDYSGELLPHVLFGEITRWAVSLKMLSSQLNSAVLNDKLVTFLEDLENFYANGNVDLRELISVSFLENLPKFGENGFEICSELGENLSHQLRVLRNSNMTF